MIARFASLLAARRGKLLLLLLCAVQFLDVVVTTAVPTAPMPPATRFPRRNRPISPCPRQPTLTGSEPPAEVL